MNILWYFLFGYGGLAAGYKFLNPSVKRIMKYYSCNCRPGLGMGASIFVDGIRCLLYWWRS